MDTVSQPIDKTAIVQVSEDERLKFSFGVIPDVGITISQHGQD